VELLRATVKLYSKGRFAEIVFSKISDAPFEDCYRGQKQCWSFD
jgi:hypothetical protein